MRNFEASVFVYWDLLAILLVQMEQWWSYDVPVDGRRAELISRQKKKDQSGFPLADWRVAAWHAECSVSIKRF